MSSQLMQDRVCGCLLGIAAGDHNGGPIQMALHLAQSLIENKSFQREDIFKKYLYWYKNKLPGWDDTGLVGRYIFGSIDL